MEVREAVEDDAEAMAALGDGPEDVMRNLVHDRTVRIATDETDSDEGASTAEETSADEQPSAGTTPAEQSTVDDPAADIRGFVSFDARDGTVHVTQLAGDRDAKERLLSEPVSFAEREGMAVELLVADAEPDQADVVEAAGFEAAGAGPQFEGSATTRYRLRPTRAEQ